MIDVSQEFQEELESGNRNYLVKVDITLADSTSLPTIENDGLFELSIEDAISQDNKFTALGSAIINKAIVGIDNSSEQYSDYDFNGATVVIQIGLQIGDELEYFDRGIYTVDTCSLKSVGMELSCLDNMAKFDKFYINSEITYPATIQEVIDDACTVCGVVFTGNYPDFDYVLQMMPVVSTFREVLSAIGQITGTYAHVDRQGRLYFKWFDIETVQTIEDVMSIIPDQNNTTIEGIRCYIINSETNEEFEVRYPENLRDEAFYLDITGNPFIHGGNIQEIVNKVGQRVIGLTIRKLTARHISNPLFEAGDFGLMPYKFINEEYEYCPFIFTRTNFGINSLQETVCGIETLLENQSNRKTEAKLLTNQLQIQTNELKEEIEQAEEEAKKVATNYLSSDESGVMIADLNDGIQTPSTATGKNVKIDNDSVDVRDGQEILASFGALAQIGKLEGAHVEIVGNRLSFKIGVTEVAYIAVDPDTGESVFYMTKAIVVQDLFFGKWQWKSRDNDNLTLKWLGEET